MSWFPWHAQSRNRDLEEEIAFDLAREAEDHLRAGLSAEEAARRSQHDFGNVLLVEEAAREMWGFAWFERFLQDVRYSLRMMARNPGFTAIAVASLALGIGANTAIYSFMDALLLRTLPVRDAQSLVVIQWHARKQPAVIHAFAGGGHMDPKTAFTSIAQPYRAYELLSQSPVLARTFGFFGAGKLNVQVRNEADLAEGEFVSGTFFPGLGVAPSFGRLIDAADDAAGAPLVAVLSYRYAQRRFGDAARAAGQTVLIDEKPFAIVGVAPPEFLGVDVSTPNDLYLPLHANLQFEATFGGKPADTFVNPNYYWLQVMARLRPGVSRAQAEAALAPIFHNFVETTAATARERDGLPALLVADGARGLDYLRRRYTEPLYVLMAMSGLILVLACTNIANLLLARATARRREMAVRLSVGAGRARVVRQLLTESVVLAAAGALAGVLVALLGIRGLTALLNGPTASLVFTTTLNWRVLAVTLALALSTGLLFGLAPALAATRVDLVPALKQVRAGQGLQLHRWLRLNLGQALVVAQLAISLLLVVAGGLFLRTLSNLYAINLGFNREHLLLFTINAKQAGYRDAALLHFYGNLQTRLQGLPGVRSASASNFALIGGGMSGWDNYKVPGYIGRMPSLYGMNVAPGFFATMQIPILLGREFDARDLTASSPTIVVNEVFAKTFFGLQSPIGRTLNMGGDMEIVGVARNARYYRLTEEPPPLVYFCYAQRPKNVGMMTFELRAAGDPLALAGSVRQAVREADARIPVRSLLTQEQQVDSTITQERTFAMLCACFAALAVIIACVGIYGMMAYNVARRTNEIGIRMALGAARTQLLWMVLRQSLALCTAGLAIGLPLAFAGARLVESFLFQMKARDPLTLSLAPALLLAAALVAGYGPAWRASRIDPWTALRDE